MGFFIDEYLRHCFQFDVQIVENTSVDDSKLMIQMISRYKWFQINFDVKLILCTASRTNLLYIVFLLKIET